MWVKSKIKYVVVLLLFTVIIAGCGQTTKKTISYHFADQKEGVQLMMGNKDYYAGFSQNDLDYKMQKKGAVMDEYRSYAAKQVESFTDKEKQAYNKLMTEINEELDKKGYKLPPLDEITFIKTTMREESGAGGYTHGTQIYLNEGYSNALLTGNEEDRNAVKEVIYHELFHCLTRCNQDFRKDMYSLIHFTVQDKDYKIPSSALKYYISNPDVEHHNAYATFKINGKDIDCFTVLATTKNFEKEGDSFFECMITGLVPIDGTDIMYTADDASYFFDIFGENTGYVIDPEECMADNFSFAMMYGDKGPDGNGYKNPEIIKGILELIKK